MLLNHLSDVGFFEGTEKLIEVWFCNHEDEDLGSKCYDLRCIPRYELDGLLLIVEAKIVSCIRNDSMDAYVLSESSLFVSKNCVVLKTCGTTKLLDALQPLIKLAQRWCGFSRVLSFFYSRRVYLRPEEQRGHHQSFKHEVDFLKAVFPGGCASVLGLQKGEEWHVYSADSACECAVSDVTMEMLMSNLDEGILANFTSSKFGSPEDLANFTGIANIIPGSLRDGVIFDPIGYSLNGLFRDSYHTIHVTPQPICSYASFETNLKLKSYAGLIERVLAVFRPGKFIFTLIFRKGLPYAGTESSICKLNLAGYHCTDKQVRELKSYSVLYMLYIRRESQL